MTDYTLPPLPYSGSFVELEAYGHQCADAARAPLLSELAAVVAERDRAQLACQQMGARIVELEAKNARLRSPRNRLADIEEQCAALGTKSCPNCEAGTMRGDHNFYNVFLRCAQCGHVPNPEWWDKALESATKESGDA